MTKFENRVKKGLKKGYLEMGIILTEDMLNERTLALCECNTENWSDKRLVDFWFKTVIEKAGQIAGATESIK